VEDTLLTVDCGTQSLRAMLFSRAGKLVDKVKVEYEPYLSPNPGWAEQDARLYWNALCAAARELKARSGPAFARVSQALGVEGVQRVFVGHRACGLVAGPQDDWDDIVIVRYRRFADFRTIVESEPYARLAKPHHRAAILNWRISATFE